MATSGIVLAFIVSGPLFAPQGSSPGLQADYWENTVTPDPAPTPPAPPAGPITRSAIQTVIDFDDTNGTNAPAAPVLPWIVTPLDNFFSRWTGYVRGPVSGAVTFETYSDDGVELRVNNTAVVTNWTFQDRKSVV